MQILHSAAEKIIVYDDLSDIGFSELIDDMAANQAALGEKIAETLKPSFAELGLGLDTFIVENLSLPEELQKILDQP